MKTEKQIYKAPDAFVNLLAVTETIIAASAGARLPGVTEDVIDYEF